MVDAALETDTYSIWLVPRGIDSARWADLVAATSKTIEMPHFVPHVTLATFSHFSDADALHARFAEFACSQEPLSSIPLSLGELFCHPTWRAHLHPLLPVSAALNYNFTSGVPFLYIYVQQVAPYAAGLGVQPPVSDATQCQCSRPLCDSRLGRVSAASLLVL
jgi:hypothetical protein